jgi:D-alanyl-D-alanine carboxypeptidase (penicillin-binding protein 5/6)
MKKLISLMLVFVFAMSFTVVSFAEIGINTTAETKKSIYSDINIDLAHTVGSVYLCEASTGKVLYAENEFKAASPASVTKVMTLLLVCEALDAGKFKLTDTVRVSANAASMGGSQVFLEEGERITVEDLIKSAVIASGNDASVALAELTAGSEAAFVKMMNMRAAELGLKNTNFENATGLDDTTKDHYSCAADIGIMSRELIKHPIILEYSSIWQDSIRDGEFTLTNTNRLVRYYDGCNGLKTGSTDKAGYCITATAKRGNMQLVAVVMGAKTRDDRNEVARCLLDFGFANYALYERAEGFVENAAIRGGTRDEAALYSTPFSAVVSKADVGKIALEYEIPEYLSAPLKSSDTVGKIRYKIGTEQIGVSDIVIKESVDRINYGELLMRMLKIMVCGQKS